MAEEKKQSGPDFARGVSITELRKGGPAAWPHQGRADTVGSVRRYLLRDRLVLHPWSLEERNCQLSFKRGEKTLAEAAAVRDPKGLEHELAMERAVQTHLGRLRTEDPRRIDDELRSFASPKTLSHSLESSSQGRVLHAEGGP